MKNIFLISIIIVAIVVMAGTIVYVNYDNQVKTSGYPDYHVDVYLNYTKGNINVNYDKNNVSIPSGDWFNVSLKAYSNYSYSFYYNNSPMYFNDSGLVNNTFYTGFLDKNVTISLNFIGNTYTNKTSEIILERGD